WKGRWGCSIWQNSAIRVFRSFALSNIFRIVERCAFLVVLDDRSGDTFQFVRNNFIVLRSVSRQPLRMPDAVSVAKHHHNNSGPYTVNSESQSIITNSALKQHMQIARSSKANSCFTGEFNAESMSYS
ncbi:hypothetical protein L9F63_023513, partial [Diploptera punctata]